MQVLFVGAASFAVGTVVGVDAAATGNYGQDITIAIAVIAIVAIGAAVPLSVLLERRRGRGARLL